MTLKRKNAIIRKIKDISIGSTLILGLLSGSAFLQSCDDGTSGETMETSYSQSVQTYIQEVEPNKFQIVHEETGAEDQASQAHINFLDGTSKSLTLEEAQRLLTQQAPDTTVSVAQNQIDTLRQTTAQNSTSSIPHNDYSNNNTTTNQNYSNSGSYYHGGGSSLSTILYYSALGNMLGRHQQQYAPAHFYHSSDSYNRSFNTNSSLRNSLSSRPRSSSSGFFGGSSRSRSFGS